MNTLFFASLWLSRISFRVLDQEFWKLCRKLERITIKQISAKAHRSFCETCLNIYIYIYINPLVTDPLYLVYMVKKNRFLKKKES